MCCALYKILWRVKEAISNRTGGNMRKMWPTFAPDNLPMRKSDYRFDWSGIWGGATLLEKIRAAYQSRPLLPNLLMQPDLAVEVNQHQDDLRVVACAAAMHGIPTPGFMSALSYYDSYRSTWLPANLIQAQRDYFGNHTYERVDKKGVFHTKWNES